MHTTPNPKVTGAASPHPLRLWPIPLLVSGLIAADSFYTSLGGVHLTVAAALAIIVAGIPHGTLDIEIAAMRFRHRRGMARAQLTLGYLACAAAMGLCWLAAPAAALGLFLIISIVHFSQDWAPAGEPFLATMVGWSLIAMPALSHPQDVAAIFALLTTDVSGGAMASVLAITAAPAALGTLVYALSAWSRGKPRAAVHALSCLIAALFLPPLIGFAIFFCLLHSPRHMRDAIRETRAISCVRRHVIVVAVTLLALALGVVMFAAQTMLRIEDGVIRTAFILLSILTVPHFVLERALAGTRRSGHDGPHERSLPAT